MTRLSLMLTLLNAKHILEMLLYGEISITIRKPVFAS
jgi:hypothetical protein